MGRLPYGCVVHSKIRTDSPNHHFSGVQSDPDPHRDPVSAERLRRVLLDQFLHVQGGVTRPHSVVFMGNRSPEERHDSVTHDLVHGPFVAMHCLHQPLEDRVEDFTCLLRVAIGQELHRPFEIRKQNRHLLALTFQRALGVEDLLGEMPRSVRVRGGEARSTSRSSRCLPACDAEGCTRWQLGLAVDARQREGSAALHAKVRLGRILLPAARTYHVVALHHRAELRRAHRA